MEVFLTNLDKQRKQSADSVILLAIGFLSFVAARFVYQILYDD
jgi:hypothetical protein